MHNLGSNCQLPRRLVNVVARVRFRKVHQTLKWRSVRRREANRLRWIGRPESCSVRGDRLTGLGRILWCDRAPIRNVPGDGVPLTIGEEATHRWIIDFVHLTERAVLRSYDCTRLGQQAFRRNLQIDLLNPAAQIGDRQ